MKFTASGMLLAVLFVLVFAGTLSGAFGIDETLRQNGIIENNVASAAATLYSSGVAVGSYALWDKIDSGYHVNPTWGTRYKTETKTFTVSGILKELLDAGLCQIAVRFFIKDGWTGDFSATVKNGSSSMISFTHNCTDKSRDYMEEVTSGYVDIPVGTYNSLSYDYRYCWGYFDGSLTQDIGFIIRAKESVLDRLQKDGDTYLLRNRKDFDYFSAYVISGYSTSGKTFKVVPENGSYIDMGDTAYVPGGYYQYNAFHGKAYQSSFQGTFDGNNKPIRNLKIEFDSDKARAALIGTLNGGGVVKNVIIGASSGDSSTISTPQSDAGSVVGYLTKGTVQDCVNYATVSSGGNQIGGIVSNLNGSNAVVKGCKNYGNVTGAYKVGGITGILQSGTIQNCYNHGSVTATSSTTDNAIYSAAGAYVAGLVGVISAGSVSYCYTDGTVTAPNNIGFLAGISAAVNASATVQYCFTAGALVGGTSTGKGYAFGHSYGGDLDTSKCWAFFKELPKSGNNVGQVSTDGSKYIRGLAGVTSDLDAVLPFVKSGENFTQVASDSTNPWEKIAETDGDGNYFAINSFSLSYNGLGDGQRVKGVKIKKANENSDASATSIAVESSYVISEYENGSLNVSLVFDAGGFSSVDKDNGTYLIGFQITTETFDASNIVPESSTYGQIINPNYGDATNPSHIVVRDASGNQLSSYEDQQALPIHNVGTYTYDIAFVQKVGRKYAVIGYDKITHTVNKRPVYLKDKNYDYGEKMNTDPVFVEKTSFSSGDDTETGLLDGHNATYDVVQTVGSEWLYGSIDSDHKSTVIKFSNFRVNNDNILTNNYQFDTEYTLTIYEGDFGVNGTDNIIANPWGSEQNPYVIRTARHLQNLAAIVNGTSEARNSLKTGKNEYVKAENKSYKNSYFVLSGDIALEVESGGYKNITGTAGTGDTENVEKLFDGKYIKTNHSKYCSSSSTVTFQFEIEHPISVQGYIWWVANDTGNVPERNPRSFKIEGSNDGTNWTVIDNRTDNSWTTTNYAQVNVFGMNGENYNNEAYKLFRVTSSSTAGQMWQVEEFRLVGYVPIGTESSPFSGTFDGNDHTISGLKTLGFYDNEGLFGYVENGSVLNLKLTDVTIGNDGDKKYHGGIAGQLIAGTIKDCNVSGWVWGSEYVGGIVGRLSGDSTISGCTVSGQVNWNGAGGADWARAGGIIGGIDGGGESVLIENCNNNATVKMWNSCQNGLGGIVGYHSGSSLLVTITGCNNNGAIVDENNAGASETGGIIGYSDNCNIDNCHNTASILGVERVGGIVGRICAGKVENCTNSGSINAQKHVGGIIGNTDGVTVTGCDNNGIVSASGDAAVGGIVGGLVGDKDELTITKCNNNEAVTAANADGVAGIIGHTPSAVNKLSVSGCKNIADITGSFNVGGIGGRIETKGNAAAEQSLLFRNCYNTGKIAAQRASEDGTVGGIVGYLYANGTTNQDVALIIYCFSSGEVNSVANINQGSIVGNATSNNAKSVRVAYCYTTNTQAYGISGKNAGTIDKTNYIIRQGTSMPSLNYGGSVFLYSSGEVSPAVISGDSYVVKAWENIVDFDINGLKITQNVAVGKFFVSDNGASGTSLKYVKPTIIQGFSTNSGDVTACYSSDLKSNIYAHVEAISIDNITNEYDEKEHAFSSTKYPNTAQNAAENTPTVYTSVFEYLGQNYGDEHPIEVDVYTATITIKIGDQVVGVKNNATSTITQRQLAVTNVWTSASEHSADDSIDYYIFSYNAIHQGIKEIKVAIVNTATMSAIPNGVCVIGAYQDTVAANSTTAYVRTVTLTDTRNYVISSTVSKYDDFDSSTELTVDASKRGVKQQTQNSNFVVTYSWKILPYDIGGNFSTDPSKTKVWFGGSEALIVGNQMLDTISGTFADGSTGAKFYPLQLQEKGNGVQQVLVYGQNTDEKVHYTKGNFVVYVRYNNGKIAMLDLGDSSESGEYTLTDLAIPTSDDPVIDTSVTASGRGNFKGDITKHYTTLFSDFGGNVTASGWGSESNPYVIDKPEYMLRLSQIVNGGMAWNSVKNTDQCYAPQGTAVATDRTYAGAYFSVGADVIDMTSYKSSDGVTDFLPIGRIYSANAHPFSGTFDGKGKTVKYSYDTTSFADSDKAHVDYVGLFGYTDGATIKNMTVTPGEVQGNDYVGGVVGYAKNSVISDVVCDFGSKIYGNNYVGGVAGKAESTTIEHKSDSVYNGSVSGREFVGGIVGEWIVTASTQIGGGVAGQSNIKTKDRSDVSGFRYVGGIAGRLDASGCTDALQFTPSFNNGTHSDNGSGSTKINNLKIEGTEYVGALFGALIGNGYHETANESVSTSVIIQSQTENGATVTSVGNVTVKTKDGGDGGGAITPKVIGGLIGYIERAGLIFNTDYKTSTVTFDFDKTIPSVLGGVVGILGKNASIEAYSLKKPNGSDLVQTNFTITHDVTFGDSSKPFGVFVGGIAGYVSSQAGTLYETSSVGTTYIFGNAAQLINTAEIYAAGFAGGLFGAVGDVNQALFASDVALVASSIGEDTDLFAVLTTGVRSGDVASTTLGIAPAVKSPYVLSASGKMRNESNIVNVTNSYVGGLIGYVGDKVTLTLENKDTTKDTTEDTTEKTAAGLSIFSGNIKKLVSVQGNYAGGLVGYLSASAHRFAYIPVSVAVGRDGAQYVGGLVGYMASGSIEHCVATEHKHSYDSSVNNFKGSSFVGGLVGYVLSATIENSYTAGFNFASTSSTKGGIIGAGQQPSISGSWTIYIAPSDSTYASATKNTYGKYISIADSVDRYNNVVDIVDAVYTFAGFGGDAPATLGFSVSVPQKSNGLENMQLVFYNASGDDEETDNEFADYENASGVLTFGIDAQNGTSMQVYVKDIEFASIPKWNASNPLFTTTNGSTTNVQQAYKKPSNSDRYTVEVRDIGVSEMYDNKGNIKHIQANVYFNGFVVGSTSTDNEKVGYYDKEMTPGTEGNPYTISNIEEWEQFSNEVKNGTDFSGKHIRLLADLSNLGAGRLAGTSEKPFSGTFDGNGHTIDLGTISGAEAGTSLFPFANGATFKNLTVSGSITGSSNGLAGFVGSATGSLTFENCKNQVAITGGGNLGGLVGETYADENSANDSFTYTFVDCVNEANIEGANVKDTSGVGGLVGNVRTGGGSDAVNSAKIQSKVELESCRNKGNITGKYNVAGIFGREGGNATVKNCGNTGNITAYGADGRNGKRTSDDDTYAAGIGGLITDNASINVFASFNTGDVLGWGNKAGGILAADCSYDASGSTSKVYYCYNTGSVTTGGKDALKYGMFGEALISWGAQAGGILGVMVNAEVRYCYNVGTVTCNGIVGSELNWTYRTGGIVGFSDGKTSGLTKVISNCYNVGEIVCGARGSDGDVGVGISQILGGWKDWSDSSRPQCTNNYALNNKVKHYKSSTEVWETASRNTTETRGYSKSWGETGSIDYINNNLNGTAGKIVESVADMTALNTRGNEIETTRTTSTSGYEALGFSSQIGALGNIEGTDGGYIFVYGCLPQLAVFALDTKNGLAMTSIGYGQNLYGEFVKQNAGDRFNPYIIKDGIDLLGLQSLVEAGFSFENKYIEFADGTNNLEKSVAKSINMPIHNDYSTRIADSENAYKYSNGSSYSTGKSYHLFAKGALCASDSSAQSWSTSGYYYDGAYNYPTSGNVHTYTTTWTQNFIAIGKNGNTFKGHLSGEQAKGTNTVINNLRITSGKMSESDGVAYGYAGLFATIENATVAYIELSGQSDVCAYSDGTSASVAGGIVAVAYGASTIDHCAIGGSTHVGAYGKNQSTSASDNNSYAGGIVGVADTKQNNAYGAGTTLTISNCLTAASGKILSSTSNVGGVLGYIAGDSAAVGKGNSVRIENCSVDNAELSAISNADTSHHIGGVIGFGSAYVPAYITGCKVGTSASGSVNIFGEYALGGIAGAMSSAVGGFIDSCTVGAKTTITRKAFGAKSIGGSDDSIRVSEDPKYGTAIGGLVGYTEAYTTKQVTTTFSGENTFAGSINVDVATTNPVNPEASIANIGGIVGDMGDGANFASGSKVVVSGNIDVTKSAMNIGGVAGRTSTATFIGTFDVHPTMTSPLAKNVGGFIGKNAGATYVLADISRATDKELKGTTITIGSKGADGNYSGSISAASNVGGIIGLNSADSVFGIGSNNVDGTNYNKGTLKITIYATITGAGDNVGGIVGLNEGKDNAYGVVAIVRGDISQNGTISGSNYVGGIVGFDNGVLETGGATADSSFSEEWKKLITKLSITNNGNVKGGALDDNDEYKDGNYVGGFIGRVNEPRLDSKATGADVDIAGTFTNNGRVEGGNYVGGLIGYVGKGITIGTKNGVSTEFFNTKEVVGHGNYIGGSIGLLLGTIQGESTNVLVKFENEGNVNGSAYVGGSIGVIAGVVRYAQFVNKSTQLSVGADTAVGGSVGYLGVPNTLKDEYGNINVIVENTHFEANGTLSVTGEHTQTASESGTESDTEWGGVGGAIGVIGTNVKGWSNNTYYAQGNVTAGKINNVGGIVGLIKADGITISNMLAYNTTVAGAKNVGGIVGATVGANTVINSAYAIEGNFSGSANVGGIIGLANDTTKADTSYWVKGYKNSDIATYDVTNLSKLGYTTGTATTGWFFLYANDADGSENLGKINTRHSTTAEGAAAEQDAELAYWKRIADAYTARERGDGDDKKELESNIVKGNGAPEKATLYATATAAPVSNEGYYMYVATSGDGQPTIEYGNVEANVLGYLISVDTDKDGAKANNVAVFYRKITSGASLTYNGYERNPIIGLEDVESYDGVITLTNNQATVADNYKNKYIFTATTVSGETETPFKTPSDPGIYTPTIKIFYVDDSSTARLVGGHEGLQWKIDARELTVKFSEKAQRIYGEEQTGTDDSVDMTITISNIAPNLGLKVPLKVIVTTDSTTTVAEFVWNNTDNTENPETKNGITLSFDAVTTGEALSEDDQSATVNLTDTNTYTLVCKLSFKDAKAYAIEVVDSSSPTARYTIQNGKGNFTVNKAELTFRRVGGEPASSAFDSTAKTTKWKVVGFKYQDGEKELAAFAPQFNIRYKDNTTKTANLYSGEKLVDGDINGPTIGITVAQGSRVEFALSNAVKKGEYWISFGNSEAGNYKFKDLQDLPFNIVEVQISISSNPSDGSKTYNGTGASITVKFTASVPATSGVSNFDGIENYADFIKKFFQIEGGNVTVSQQGGTGKGKEVSWTITTGKDAGTYTFQPKLIEEKESEFAEGCSYEYKSTFTYKINKRTVTLTTTSTSTQTYTYNTEHQGLSKVTLNGESGNAGVVKGDTVKVTVSVSGGNPSTLSFSNTNLSQSAGIETIDAGTYSASFALDATSSKNYTLSASSLTWTINQYEVQIGDIGLSGSRPYNGEATTPTIKISGVDGSNGTYTYRNDTFTIEYKITKDGTTVQNGDKLKNAGEYQIEVGNGSGSIKAHRRTNTSIDTSKNYKFSNTNRKATYIITPLDVTIEWNKQSFVYTASNHMLSIKSVKIADGESISMNGNSVDSGMGNDRLTFTLKGGGTDAGSNHTTTATLSSVSGDTDGIESVVGNYNVVSGATSESFTIAKSRLKIEYSGGNASRVYNGSTNVTDHTFGFTVTSTNFGASGSADMFDIAMSYDTKNVGTGKAVTFRYSYISTDQNYEYVESTKSQTIAGVGEITPLDIQVLLNKLRNGKATRTFNGNTYYGGEKGVSGSGNSATYRSGEGFSVKGVFSGDDVKVVAEYKEAGDGRELFDSYVNNIYKVSEETGTFGIAGAGTYLKKLVFTMSGDDAPNYTFNVYTGDKAYSDKSSVAGEVQTLTVYDSRSNSDGNKNATTAPTINIEITVKTYKVTYVNTAQSYANADNTYNTDWQRVVAREVPDGVTVTVANGWMFADGKDHTDEEQAEKRRYTEYTTIRGSQNSVKLGAKISGVNGMELNYRMSNQPILTIGYFVAQGDVYEIGSAAGLMIASYYWWVAQNKDDPDFNQELVASSTWHKVVSNDDYVSGEYKKPSDAPEGISDKLTSWDDYFAAFEEKTGKSIFLNETGVSGETGTWGYYEENASASSVSYTKFKLVNNFSGVLTDSDIMILNTFFRVYNQDTEQFESKEWGFGGQYITNFLKSSSSSTLTALSSVFMSVESSTAPCEFDGNGYVIEYINIMGYGKSNVGFFDIVGSNSVVKNLHLRNVTINANQGNVGGIAGSVLAAAEAASESSIKNVSFHGTINATGGVVGGLFGVLARAVDGAIVLGTINANGVVVGGVAGTMSQEKAEDGANVARLDNVVSLMQVIAYGGTVGAFTTTQGASVQNSVHMTNAVWQKPSSGAGFVNVTDKNKSFNELMRGSVSGYGSNKYYHIGEEAAAKGAYDVLKDVSLTELDAENSTNARESMRLKDIVSVYLMMYSLTKTNGTLATSDGNSVAVNVYAISSSSWLVGSADGTDANPISVANKQNVSLLRQLPFAAFTLKTNVSISISSTFVGAFFGRVESAKDASGASLGYKITCNKAMFEAYASDAAGWLKSSDAAGWLTIASDAQNA